MSGITIRFIAVIVSATYALGIWLSTGTADFGFLKFFSAAVFVATLAWSVWDRWGWKWPVAQRISKTPRDISGTWQSTLDSAWVNPETHERPAPKTVYVVVRQTSSSVIVTLVSDESRSQSTTARVVLENDSWLLHYLYTNEPTKPYRKRSPIHHGCGVLEIVGSPVQRLTGAYWTDRDSSGTLALTSRVKEYGGDFEQCEELFEHGN